MRLKLAVGVSTLTGNYNFVSKFSNILRAHMNIARNVTHVQKENNVDTKYLNSALLPIDLSNLTEILTLRAISKLVI